MSKFFTNNILPLVLFDISIMYFILFLILFLVIKQQEVEVKVGIESELVVIIFPLKIILFL